MAGFGVAGRHPGAPDLPERIFRVAIPPGSVPTLEATIDGETLRPGVVPRPQARFMGSVRSDLGPEPRAKDVEANAVLAVRQKDPELYGGLESYPPRAVWLGEIGALRDQRYVEVHVAPVRFDPRIRGVRIAHALDVTVRFEGAPRVASAPSFDPPLESVYRNSFVNYEQGTLFRIGATTSEAPAASAFAAPAAPATGPLYRIRVRQNGVVRLNVARLTGTGFLAEPIASWKLSCRGVEAPLRVEDTNGNGLLDGAEWVQFFGQALDDEPKTVLNSDFPNTDQDIYEARDFSDENIYFLSVEPGSRARIPARASDPTNVRTPPVAFDAVAHAEVDNAWRPLGAADPWYWLPTLGANVAPTSRTDSVSLPGLASGTASARVKVKLRGISEDLVVAPDHHSRVTLKNGSGQTLAVNDDNGTFEGRALYVHDFTWTFPGSGNVLTSPAQVTLQSLPVATLVDPQLILDWIEIGYRRSFTAASDTLTFDYPDGDAEFQIGGLSSGNPEIWEITSRVGASPVVSPVRLTNASSTGAGPFTIRFRVDNDPAIPDGASRRFVVAGGGAVVVPADPDFRSDTVSDLRDPLTQADMIVIASPTVLGAAGSAARATLTSLLNYHASNGISSKIVTIEDVQDEFNDGLAGPLAVKNFLAWVMSGTPGTGWASPKPRYVLVLGDGSYDYKGGEASGNFVPTQILFLDSPQLGYYASDNLMAAVVGTDNLADLVVGRIPARDPTTLNGVLQKILTYEQAPPTGNWRRHAVVISDRGKMDAGGVVNAGESVGFEDANDAGLATMKTPPHTNRRIRYYSDYYLIGRQPIQCTNDIRSAVNGTDGVSNGASIVQFIGHGNFDLWSDDSIFTKTDTDSLTNGSRAPWLLAHNCLTGGFHTTQARSIGEDWLTRSAGGAIAVLAPSDLSFNFVGPTVIDTIWGAVFGKQKVRAIDVAVLDNLSQLCGQGSIEPCQAYVLLGDPATDLVFPAVAPATNVQATPGNAQNQLAWTASTTPGTVKYDVYRTVDPVTTAYAKVTSAPLTTTSYTDTGLFNTTTYYYYVVATDVDGFESRWSNFNGDCAVSGPDCVRATPTNPNPPAPPTGLTVTDPESGGLLNLTWTANSETDLKSYDVYWGTASGAYTNVRNVGKFTNAAIGNLTNGVTYYFALKATNTSGRTSGFSQEMTGVPTFVRGVRSPRFISDLRLVKSGAFDIVLSWGAVTTDIYGKSETLQRYEVYRGSTPDFLPGAGNKIGQPTVASFTDLGARSIAGPLYYLVRAIDVEGNPGGLGRQLPNGIDTMTLGKGPIAGNVTLSWPAIVTDFDGAPTLVDHYEVYARATPFSRGDVRNGTIPLLSSTAATSATFTPPTGPQYYSVIVVDAKGNKSPF